MGVAALARRAGPRTLNLSWRDRLSASSLALAIGLARGRRAPTAASVLGLVGLNHAFYTLLLRRCGPRQAAAGVALHAVHHLTALVALPAGLAVHLVERRRGDEHAGAAERPRRELGGSLRRERPRLYDRSARRRLDRPRGRGTVTHSCGRSPSPTSATATGSSASRSRARRSCSR